MLRSRHFLLLPEDQAWTPNARVSPISSDLTDQEWAILAPELPPPVPAGAPRTTALREVVNGILYRLHNGCAWRALPHDLPAEGTVRDYFHRWRRTGLWQHLNDILRRRVRRAEGRNEKPSAGIIDSQSAKGLAGSCSCATGCWKS